MKGGDYMAIKGNPPKTGLEKVMRLRGISYRELAEEIGASPGSVHHWAMGRIIPQKKNRKAVEEALGVHEYELFYREIDEDDLKSEAS